MKQGLFGVGCVVVVAIAAGGYARAAEPQQPSAGPAGASEHQALIDQYCVTCHNQRSKTANLMLDQLELTRVGQDAEVWERVVRKLRAGMMPPALLPRPDERASDALIAWLETELDRHATPYAPPPGLHRLNRTEYANAVRDLLGLAIDPASYLPSDDSTHGFDNIAGALGLSSTLVEAYVSAAQKVSRLAIGEPEPPTLKVYRTPEDTSQDYHIEGLPFGTRGGMLIEHVFPSDGEYSVTITPIFGDNMSPAGFGTVPCERLEVLLDGERLQVLDWQGGGRGRAPDCGRGVRGIQQRGSGQSGPEAFFGGRGGSRMQVRFATTAGPHQLGVTFLQTNLAPLLDLDRHFMRDTLQTGPTPGYTFFPHVGTVRIEGPFDAAPAQDSPSRRRIFVCRPSSADEETDCARTIVRSLARRAYRGPVSEADVTTLMGFYASGRQDGDFDAGIEMVLARVLASPKFIYRIEEEPAAASAQQPYRISDADLASRLSFFLWSSIPDDELLDLAERGTLSDPAVLDAQVRRMLQDPRAEALSINFAGQWLNLRGMDSVGPLPMLYPDFDNPLRQSMRREVELLFDSIVREDRSVVELLNADYTFVDERLAKHYGIPNIYGSQFRRVTLGPEMDVRKGLVGKGAILTTSSKPDRTSPVTRGKWIMTNVLGMSPPDPPPNVPALPARVADATGNAHEPTMREKMLDHRISPSCTQCHRLMDPIGFALENFDGIAAWRTEDVGAPIDASAQVFDGTELEGPGGLREWLVGYSDQFVQVVAEKLLVYALGRGVDHQDMPLVRAIGRDAARSDNRFSALVLGVVRSTPFQMNMKVQEPVNSARAE